MKRRLLAAFAVLATLVPSPATNTDDFHAAGIEFLARVSPSHFDALNPTTQTLLLTFRAPSSGAMASLLVPPLAEVEYQFPAGSASNLTLEVCAVVDGVPRTTSPVLLATLEPATVDALWVYRHVTVLHTFKQCGASFEPIDPGSFGGAACASSGSAHIPEVSPVDMTPPALPKTVSPWEPPF
ncbi:MAG: hypothetical protein L6Q99_14395 [Planctomycetes bacterium]|nr:hypothetical protein [Planctomycetota bacterium]